MTPPQPPTPKEPSLAGFLQRMTARVGRPLTGVERLMAEALYADERKAHARKLARERRVV